MLKKRVPPPMKEPGTHTNAEVKEALHARGIRRSIVVMALVILLLASLVVVSNIASEYTDEAQTRWTPRVVVLSVSGLSATTMNRAVAGNKAPFLSLLNSTGGVYGSMSVSRASGQSPLVPLLTGNATTTANTLSGSKTFLKELNTAGFTSIVVAPETYYSGTTTLPGTGVCSHVGLLDTECVATACPNSTSRYCASTRQYISCNGVNCLYDNELLVAMAKMVNNRASAMFMQLDVFDPQISAENATSRTLTRRSRANLVDDLVGTIAVALAERTRTVDESWLIVLVGDGDDSEARAPVAMAAYANGELVRLNRIPTTAALTDIRGTVLKWFGLTPAGVDQSRNLGLCSDGIAVVNCKSS